MKGLKLSIFGIGIETIGLILDVLHHLEIGIKTPEGLLTFQHTIIFVGFLINFVGVLILFFGSKRA